MMTSRRQSGQMLFKILRVGEWSVFLADGLFNGSPDDLRDGFIHLSAESQVAGTRAKHFAGESGLWLVAVDVEDDPCLRWEGRADGILFPHLFRPLQMADVKRATLIS